MKKNIILSAIIVNFVFILIFSLFLSASSQTINVKEYIKDKFPPVFSLHLSSLNDLDSYEKEFIDLLEKLPEEEQEYYAKVVYKYGFSRELLGVAKEGKPIVVYAEAYDKALNLIEKREYKNALPYLETAVKTDISSLKAQAYFQIGYCYDELDNFTKSIEAYKQATRINPDDADSYYTLGNVYSDLFEFENAVEAYKQAIRIDPNHAKVHSSLGNAYNCLGFCKEAIEACKQAIRIDPEYIDAYNNLGGGLY